MMKVVGFDVHGDVFFKLVEEKDLTGTLVLDNLKDVQVSSHSEAIVIVDGNFIEQIKRNWNREVKPRLKLQCTRHESSNMYADSDDIDMSDWSSSASRKEYFPALHDDENMNYPYSLLDDEVCWQERNSFEFNRRPVSQLESFLAMYEYFQGGPPDEAELKKIQKYFAE